MVAAASCLAAGAGAIGWATGAIQAPATTSADTVVPTVTGDPRADALLARMSLAQKLRLLEWAAGAGQTAVLPGVARLGVPPLHLTEGGLGSATRPAPALADPPAVAATFSRADAYATGAVLGRDARALGEQAVARPFAGIDAAPEAGQAGASFGEDPLLAGQTAAAQIDGIQAQGTMALVRNFLSTGSGVGLMVDPAALHEIYLQPFADAAAAGAAGVMCAPGQLGVGGQAGSPSSPACGDAGLLSQILRRELRFGGFVVAGRGANPGMVSLNSGLDGEIPGPGRAGRHFTPAAVRAALANGTIAMATINQAAGAVLAEMDRFGLLGRAQKQRATPEPVAADERVVARTAQDAATLLKNTGLKNTGRVLPLSGAELGSLALIGPGAAQVIAADPEGGNGTGIPGRRPGTLQALRQDLAGDHSAHLRFAVGDDLAGIPVPAAALSHYGQPGLARATAGTGATRVVSVLDNTTAHGNALPAGSAHTWTGQLTVPATGSYWINLALGGARGTLTLDGGVVAQDQSGPGQGGALLTTPDGLDNLRARVTLTAGTHTLAVRQVPDGSHRPVQVSLDWVTPAQQQADLAAAVAAARSAKAAVVFAWSAASTASAGSTLPDGQDQLIEDVAAANPDTIVVLNTPGPVSMPWLASVQAVLEMWYPGDGGGSATANVLLGKADPAGRLPVTWPAAGRTAPAGPEGVYEGYRWYDHEGIRPLFPFGYGLSYTSFRYSGLSWRTAAGGGLAVRFRVTDSGTLAGDAVPQVYLGAPARCPPGAAFAAKALAAYTRISLRPGQTRTVTLLVPRRQLQYWDDTRGWLTAAGPRPLDVGPDEQADALSATVTVRG
jgi:beta-glucosidase